MESKKYTLNKEDLKKIGKAAGYVFLSAGCAGVASWIITADVPSSLVIFVPLINVLLVTASKFFAGK